MENNHETIRNVSQEKLFGISHLASCSRPAWTFFLIFFLLHRFARTFSSPPSVFLSYRGCTARCGCSVTLPVRKVLKTEHSPHHIPSGLARHSAPVRHSPCPP